MRTVKLIVGIMLSIVISTGASIPPYFLNPISSDSTTGYALVCARDGIQIYERWFEYEEGVMAREIKAVFNVEAGMDSVTSLLKNEQKAKCWNKGVSDVGIVKMATSHWLTYFKYDLPWPFDDQDCVLAYTLTSSADRTYLEFESTTDDSFPVYKGITRMEDVKGKWVISKENDSVRIEYEITTRPSKTLPRWITDPIIRNNLMSTMEAFRSNLEKPKK